MAGAVLKSRIDQALKQAMLDRDSTLATTLRGLKSAIQYAEVAANKREAGLSDAEIQAVLAREAKKRQESIDLYKQGGNEEKATAEAVEKDVIEAFLPPKMSHSQLQALVDQTVSNNLDLPLGQMIGLVKQAAGIGADGAEIASLVRQRMGV